MTSPHAVVIGASSGIGLSIARKLKSSGFFVSGLSRRAPSADAVDTSMICDVLDPEGLSRCLCELKEQHGTPEVVVYSAGYPVMGKSLSVPENEGRRTFEIHFWGLDRVIRAALPDMQARRRGTILAVLSISAHIAPPYEAYYAASKSAAAAYLRSVALEAGHYGVRLKWLAPGYIDTGFLEKGHWFGMSVPTIRGSGVTPEQIGEWAFRMIQGGPDFRIIGWRERFLALGEKLAPRLVKSWLSSKCSKPQPQE
jgi:short-subunit dehydrogenase